MSTAEILSLISIISYVVSTISLVLALFFWFYFKIPSVIGDLSGRTAQKSIARMRANNESSGKKSYKSSATNVRRGKLTDTMQQSKKLAAETAKKTAGNKTQSTADGLPGTDLLAANKAETAKAQQTEQLAGANETELLPETDETTPLYQNGQPAKKNGGIKLTMLDEVMLIQTNEVIS